LALAGYTPRSDQWAADDRWLLAEQLVAANPEHQPRLREYLRAFHTELLPDLERLLCDHELPESQQLGAANAVADFARQDVPRLARLLTETTAGPYLILYPLVADSHESVEKVLRPIMTEQPLDGLGITDRVKLGKRRAGAAITLFRLGARNEIFDTLRVHDDPEALTQFAHGCRDREVTTDQLLDCLHRADALRQTKSGQDRKVEDRVLFGFLLALGEFRPDDLPSAQRDSFVSQLVDWYASDPSSAIHGATAWLLRHWGYDEQARTVDQTPVAYDPEREWFTLEIKVKTSDGAPQPSFYLTFVVFPAGKYVIGTDDPGYYEDDATRHVVEITRPLAFLDREITRGEFQTSGVRMGTSQLANPTPEQAAGRMSWYGAVRFCRWLGQQHGLSEDQQPYPDPKTLDTGQYPPNPDPVAEGAPRDWPVRLDRAGFRLPTESEWEIASRGGMRTVHSFGGDSALLGRYEWFEDNSNQEPHAPRVLRCNLRGVFDMPGNVGEWCHDWAGDYPSIDAVDPLGPAQGSLRAFRGAGWLTSNPLRCRSAFRDGMATTSQSDQVGFRVALVPSAPTAAQH
jgi:formylglycine-generating enzyme required for sulfatase activity